VPHDAAQPLILPARVLESAWPIAGTADVISYLIVEQADVL
jgi:hypothetical protein